MHGNCEAVTSAVPTSCKFEQPGMGSCAIAALRYLEMSAALGVLGDVVAALVPGDASFYRGEKKEKGGLEKNGSQRIWL